MKTFLCFKNSRTSLYEDLVYASEFRVIKRNKWSPAELVLYFTMSDNQKHDMKLLFGKSFLYVNIGRI